MLSVPVTRRLSASLVTAAVVAAVAHVFTVFIFFVGNDFAPEIIGIANGFFGFSTLILFVLLAVGIFFTELARWYTAAIVGLLAGVIAALLGALLSAITNGSALDSQLAQGLLTSLVGVNLTFVLAAVVLTVAAAPWLFDRLVTARPAKLRSGRVLLVRLPSPDLSDGAVTHIERTEIDTDLADTQWAEYVDVFRAEGWNILEVPMAPDLADSVFVEDAVVVFGDIAVITRPGSDHRRDEIEDVEMTVRSLGMSVARITEPATLDGGDVLAVGDTVYVGRGGRTNAEGVAQLRAILRQTGRSVVAVPVTGVLHLKSAVTALPDGTVIGDPAAVDPRLFPRFLEMPEPEGGHVVELAPDALLISSAAPRSKELLESLGYRVETADISEFEKLEGCVTCLSVRIS